MAALGWTTRVRDALDAASAEERDIVESTLDEFGSVVLDGGAWHGDLTPWNLLTSSRGVGLIDWEFAAAEVPVGFDVCHFHTQVGMELRGLDAARALDRAASVAATDLATLGQSPTSAAAVWRLYLVELARRTFALRGLGFDTSGVHQGPAALRLLARTMPVATGSPRGDQR